MNKYALMIDTSLLNDTSIEDLIQFMNVVKKIDCPICLQGIDTRFISKNLFLIYLADCKNLDLWNAENVGNFLKEGYKLTTVKSSLDFFKQFIKGDFKYL